MPGLHITCFVWVPGGNEGDGGSFRMIGPDGPGTERFTREALLAHRRREAIERGTDLDVLWMPTENNFRGPMPEGSLDGVIDDAVHQTGSVGSRATEDEILAAAQEGARMFRDGGLNIHQPSIWVVVDAIPQT